MRASREQKETGLVTTRILNDAPKKKHDNQ